MYQSVLSFDSFESQESVVCITVEANSIAVDYVADGKPAECKKQGAEDWPLGDTKA